MNLTTVHKIIASGRRTVAYVTGGVQPYTFSCDIGEITADGRYTAPMDLKEGEATITVTDNVGESAETVVQVTGIIELVCDIIQKELGLDSNHIRIYNSTLPVPKDKGLLIAVAIDDVKPFGSSAKYDGSGSDLVSIQSMNVLMRTSIDVMSKDLSAMIRKEEVLLALGSDYAQTQMENNGFYLAKIPLNFTPISGAEGSAIPYRFNISVNVQYSITKRTVVPSYNNFDQPEILIKP